MNEKYLYNYDLITDLRSYLDITVDFSYDMFDPYGDKYSVVPYRDIKDRFFGAWSRTLIELGFYVADEKDGCLYIEENAFLRHIERNLNEACDADFAYLSHVLKTLEKYLPEEMKHGDLSMAY